MKSTNPFWMKYLHCQNKRQQQEMCQSTCTSLMGGRGERVARTRRTPLGPAHLCPACMTVDGKTYGGASRGVVCVSWGRWQRWNGMLARPRPAGTSRGTLGGGWGGGGQAEGGVRCQDDLHTAPEAQAAARRC